MVAIDSSSVYSTSAKERKELINQLFSTNAHRFSEERLATILWWTEAETGKPSFFSKFAFLQKVWCDKNFRPFDNVASSVKHLTSHKDQDFLIRLSTSQTGGITLTFRRELKTDRIVHTRFSVDHNSCITDSNGNQHQSIASLVNWFSFHRYRNSTATPAGYVCPSY
mmetsp:Transcript_7864/g.12434  ORF Transcript_7864/g.12434 Transcript_7864/m.12434 type:complete len:167 (+) Transcript_7864:56-556(+)